MCKKIYKTNLNNFIENYIDILTEFLFLKLRVKVSINVVFEISKLLATAQFVRLYFIHFQPRFKSYSLKKV